MYWFVLVSQIFIGIILLASLAIILFAAVLIIKACKTYLRKHS